MDNRLLQFPKVVLNGMDTFVNFLNYNNGAIAIELLHWDSEDECIGPWLVATVNLPSAVLFESDVVIKNYSENNGVLPALIEAGIVAEPHRKHACNSIVGDICKLLIEPVNPEIDWEADPE